MTSNSEFQTQADQTPHRDPLNRVDPQLLKNMTPMEYAERKRQFLADQAAEARQRRERAEMLRAAETAAASVQRLRGK